MSWGSYTPLQLFPPSVLPMNDVADYRQAAWRMTDAAAATQQATITGTPVATIGGYMIPQMAVKSRIPDSGDFGLSGARRSRTTRRPAASARRRCQRLAALMPGIPRLRS
jgi:hypothetical protein